MHLSTPADVPAPPRRDLAALDRLLRHMEQRLALMHEAAQWKWTTGQSAPGKFDGLRVEVGESP